MRKIFISLTVALIVVGIASYTLALPSPAIPNPGHPASEIGGTSDEERTFNSTGKYTFLGDLDVKGGITLGGVRKTEWPSGGITKLSELIIDADKDWNGKSITNLGKVGIGTTNPGAKLEVNGSIKLSGTSPTYKITNLADPTNAQDAATKAYVDQRTERKIEGRRKSDGEWVVLGTLANSGWTAEDSENIAWDIYGNRWRLGSDGFVYKNEEKLVWGMETIEEPRVGGRPISASDSKAANYCKYCKNKGLISWEAGGWAVLSCWDVREGCTCIGETNEQWIKKITCADWYDGLRW